jgi:hypothetical protein
MLQLGKSLKILDFRIEFIFMSYFIFQIYLNERFSECKSLKALKLLDFKILFELNYLFLIIRWLF